MKKKEQRAVGEIKRALLELQARRRPIAAEGGRSAGALLKAGVLSPESAAFIRKHKARFLGFHPNRSDPGIAVLAVDLTSSKPPVRLIGFSDGRVAVERPRPRMTDREFIAKARAKALKGGCPSEFLTSPRVSDAVCVHFGGYGSVSRVQVWLHGRTEEGGMMSWPAREAGKKRAGRAAVGYGEA
jgi:hypothetical protein